MRKVIVTGLALVILVAGALPALSFAGRSFSETPYITTSPTASAAQAEYNNPKCKKKGNKKGNGGRGEGDGGPKNQKGKNNGGDGRGGKGDGGPCPQRR